LLKEIRRLAREGKIGRKVSFLSKGKGAVAPIRGTLLAEGKTSEPAGGKNNCSEKVLNQLTGGRREDRRGGEPYLIPGGR